MKTASSLRACGSMLGSPKANTVIRNMDARSATNNAELITYVSSVLPHPVITVSRSRIRPYSDGSFMRDPEEDAVPAIMLVVGDELGDYFDTVAWDPRSPGRWWLEYGRADVLGLQSILYCEFNQTPLTLFATPRDWLFGRGAGACLLSWDVDPRVELGAVPEVRCESDAVREKLRKRIWELARPDFTISSMEVRRAA